MEILTSKHLKKCLDGTAVKEYRVDQAIPPGFVDHVAPAGVLLHLPNLPRPFFRVTVRRRFVLKGIVGNLTFQVHYLDYSSENEQAVGELVASWAG